MNNTKLTREMLVSIKEELAKQGKTLSPNSNYFKRYKETLTGFSESQKESAIGHLGLIRNMHRMFSSNSKLMLLRHHVNKSVSIVVEMKISHGATPRSRLSRRSISTRW